MKSITTWKKIALNSLLALGLTGTAAGTTAATNNNPTQPQSGGTLIAALQPEPRQLNTAFDNQYANAVVSSNIFEGLLTYDADFKPQPGLAQAWSVSEDGKTITFKLRQNVRWHDGQAFTSNDVKFSVLELWKKLHARGRITFAAVQDVLTPDAHTVVFVLDKPNPAILSALNSAESQVLPAHVYAGEEDIRKSPKNNTPIGTGPFKFQQWDKGQSITLVRNEDYWDKGKPYLDRVIFRSIADAAARSAALETGEVQYLPYSGVPFSDVERLRKDPHLKFETRGYSFHSQVYFLEYNLRRPQLSDKRVRQAIALAFSRQALADTVWYGLATPAYSPIPASVPAFHNANVPRYDLDIDRANALLDEAGFPRGANGTRFAINIDVPPTNDRYPLAAEYIRQSLSKVGIDVKIIQVDQASYLSKVFGNYDFDLQILGYSIFQDPQLGLTRVVWSKAAKPGISYVNASGYASPQADALIEAYQEENDPKKRQEQFLQLQSILVEDLPVLPLLEAPFFSFYRDTVHGLSTAPDGVLSSLKNVWIAP
ncbi:ABC transporter substrate-binding protein [Lampropedia puyangensis]|uniref:ABC transporter substrate-binding protein n=1 Tax=Lampropedia puyangensis TaxID=1330072 RepID=A0A4S8EUF9_9BURK|nr:ABC transporter substrate-binding protein [Lampropedia puyangensis]THT98088.1 ABC transporter substrate-binding protein [Lampropedia puyangensis]